MLDIKHMSVSYGKHLALIDASLHVKQGEIVVILGANGAGKSSLLRATAGICDGTVSGSVSLNGRSLDLSSPDKLVDDGLALVPEGRGIFGDLTVAENLSLGAYSARARADEVKNLDRVFQLFPKLIERKNQVARTMSGGEQQMVAIGRAIMSSPKILMLDEPSLGLSPLLCSELFSNLSSVKELGIGVLLVEQNAKQSLAIADRGYLLENAKITHTNDAISLMNDTKVQKAYLGALKEEQTVSHDVKEQENNSISQNKIVITSNGTPRRNADEHIGSSVDELVRIASDISAKSVGLQVNQKVKKPFVSASRIEILNHDFETAAANARNLIKNRISKPTQISNQKTEAEISETKVIEIYKRPKIEIFKRTSSRNFERQ